MTDPDHTDDADSSQADDHNSNSSESPPEDASTRDDADSHGETDSPKGTEQNDTGDNSPSAADSVDTDDFEDTADRSAQPDEDTSLPVDANVPSERPPDTRTNTDRDTTFLAHVFRFLEQASAESSDVQSSSAFDFDISIQSGPLDEELDAARSPPTPTRSPSNRTPASRSRPASNAGGRQSDTRREDGSNEAVLVSIDRRESELVVTGDVAAIDSESVTVGFDDGDLVVRGAQTEIERVPVTWDDPIADAVIHNDVLTVRVRAGDDTDE